MCMLMYDSVFVTQGNIVLMWVIGCGDGPNMLSVLGHACASARASG